MAHAINIMRPLPVSLRPTWTTALRAVVLAGIYYAVARLGLRFATVGESISLLWPATGVAIAGLVLLGYRYWPAIALGSLLANLATAVPVAATLGIATGNTLEALLAAWILRRVAGNRPRFDDVRHVRALMLGAAPLGALISAGFGVCSLWAAGVLSGAAALPAGVIWWEGDWLGAVVLCPAILSWTIRSPRPATTRRRLEIAVIGLGTAIAIGIGIARVSDLSVVQRIMYPYIVFPFVVWSAVRFGARGATMMTLALATATTLMTLGGRGPFAGGTPLTTSFALSVYISAIAVTGLMLAAAVVWERNRATSALSRSEQRLRLALDAARMGSWFWSVENDALNWDDHLGQLYGLRAGESVTSYDQFIARVHPDDRTFVGDTVRRALETGGSLDYVFRIVLPDGQICSIADQGQVVRDASGHTLYVTGVCMDVTERRSAEERLRQAHRMESVGRLAGGVAHEANNQMSVVLGAADFVLRRSDLHEDARDDLEQIRKAAVRTAAVTSQLLAFSRRQMMQPRLIELNGVVAEWESVLRRLMGADFTVVLDLHPDTGTVTADPGQLEQVLLNLALNARDAMPRGGRLTLETFRIELGTDYGRGKPEMAFTPGWYAALAVSDTGHGMSRDTLRQIFEPFFTTKPTGQGTGLGLSTVYGIVKQSGGYVWAYSEPGQGTTLKVYLPWAGQPATPLPRPEPQPVAAGGTVLVVEDDEMVRRLTRRALQSAGYEVVEAASGEAALELMTSGAHVIDLILTDVVMTGMSGRDLATRVKERFPAVPVLFTSGYTDSEIVRRGLLDQTEAFMQKPYTPAGIAQFVRERLAAATATAAR